MSQTTCTKVAYATPAEAHAVAQHVRSGHRKRARTKPARAYRCPACGAYHLTSQRERP